MDQETLDYITIAGAIVTLIGTAVTIWHARKTRRYSIKVAHDLRKLYASEIVENLKRAQDDCRKLLTNIQQLNRGKSHTAITESIQRHLDHSLNLLPLDGPDSDVRELINDSQSKLRDFQNAGPKSKSNCASDLHTRIQDAIGLSRQRFHFLEYGEAK